MNDIWALSGGIACGKSTVARMLMARGAQVIDADDIAREVVEVGTEGLREVVDAFGPSMRLPSGELDREALGARIFDDEEARHTLNAILHPKIFERSLFHMQQARTRAQRPIFYDAALLVENGSYQYFKGLVIVASSPERQRERLMKRNGFTEQEAQMRIDAQWPLEKKVAVADHVIWNDADLDELEQQVDHLLGLLAASGND